MWEASGSLLQRAVEENLIHGFALALGRGDKILLRSVGGSLGRGGPMVTESTRYDLDALTQAMVTVPLTLLAVEKGWLSIDDSISLHVKAPGDKRGLTLRHLLTHTGGMAPGFLLEQETESPKGALAALLAHPLDDEPGKRIRHSGMGFLLLGKILEQVYGMPLDAAAKRYIFTPLGLLSTGYLPTGSNIALTEADTLTGEPRAGLPDEENTRFLHGVSGTAGVFSSLGDCCRFLSMLAGKGRLEGRQFLTSEAVRLLCADHTPGMKEAWGLGVQLGDRGAGFLGEMWPKGSYGLWGITGGAFAVEPSQGVYAVLLCNRVQTAHESRAYQRFLRLALNSAYAGALRMMEEKD